MYSKMVSAQILTSNNLLTTMVKGPNSDIFFDIVDKHMHESLDNNAGVIGNTMVRCNTDDSGCVALATLGRVAG